MTKLKYSSHCHALSTLWVGYYGSTNVYGILFQYGGVIIIDCGGGRHIIIHPPP